MKFEETVSRVSRAIESNRIYTIEETIYDFTAQYYSFNMFATLKVILRVINLLKNEERLNYTKRREIWFMVNRN